MHSTTLAREEDKHVPEHNVDAIQRKPTSTHLTRQISSSLGVKLGRW
jgi:hypothetical protein